MSTSVLLFVDFWNLTLNWRDRSNGARLDWVKVPGALLKEAEKAAGIDAIAYKGTRVYASYNTQGTGGLKRWLDTFLDRQAGFTVYVRERRPRKKPLHCVECDTETANCPACHKPFRRAAEKGVDSHIVTDLMSLAWEDAYKVAILVTGDADFVPAVLRLQDKGIRVVNATWAGHGHELAKACWASFALDPLIPNLIRST